MAGRETDCDPRALDVLPRDGAACGRGMDLGDHRGRHRHTRDGPVAWVCTLDPGPDPPCPGTTQTQSPDSAATFAPPQGALGWDVGCGIGPRRCARHWAIPPI
jgi:hypothetical protein